MSAFWTGRRVAVTGADGFIGSHLVEALLAEGAFVRALVNYNSFGLRGWLEDIDIPRDAVLELRAGDVRDSGFVREFVRDSSHVFHLASLIAIPYSYQAPESYVQTNVLGGLNVLRACLDAKVERLVHTSTSEVYGTARYVPIDENHPLQGQSPYAASKIGADALAESFHRSFGLPVAIARPFNTYGPRQSARAVIPTILSQLHLGAREIKLGALDPTRDFNFVKDTAAGFLAVAGADAAVGRVTNIGSGREISIGDLFELCCRITGCRAVVRTDENRLRPAASEVNRLLCDASFLRSVSGWQPRHSLEEGLQQTSAWIRDHLDVFRPDEYNV